MLSVKSLSLVANTEELSCMYERVSRLKVVAEENEAVAKSLAMQNVKLWLVNTMGMGVPTIFHHWPT